MMIRWIRAWWSRQCWHDWFVLENDVSCAFGQWDVLDNRVCLKCGKKENELDRARAIEADLHVANMRHRERALELWNKGE